MTKRIFALMLAVLMLAVSLTACGEKDEKVETDKEEDQNLAYTPDREVLDSVVMKVGDVEVTYETYRYYYMSCRSTYEASGTSKTVKELQDEVLEEIIYQSAIQSLANQFDAGLTSEQSQTVDLAYAELNQTYKDYDSDLESALALRYMTPTVYKDLYAFETYLVENVFTYSKDAKNNVLDFSDEAIEAMLADYDRALMVFVGITDERNDAAALKKVEGVLELLAGGEDFVKAATDHSDYSDVSEAEQGFYFKKGELDEAVEEAYYALAEGEYTKTPVKTDSGYYILYRIAENKEYFAENLYPSYAFNAYLRAYEDAMEIIYTDFFNTMFEGKDLIHEKIK